MPGFVVTYFPSAERSATDDATCVDSPEAGITISQDGVEYVSRPENRIVLIDGYAIGVTPQRLAAALDEEDDGFLSRLHGHYCALVIQPNGDIRGFCDRIGARTLFWQSSIRRGVEISSNWPAMPIRSRGWDPLGLSETLRYRWITGQRTILSGVSSLPLWQRVLFTRSGEIRLQKTAQAPAWTLTPRSSSFSDTLAATRTALGGSLEEVARTNPNAAIFLSGGVDSALLAALAKTRFEKCLLVSPVFPGNANPELEVARKFAKTLGLQYLLVDFDMARVETDLRDLVRAKGGQVNFLSLAMRQMIAAIPEEYPLLIYGEAADILFGSSRFQRADTLLRRQRYLVRVPDAMLAAMSCLPGTRLDKLRRLKDSSPADLALGMYRIPYPDDAVAVIDSLCCPDLNQIEPHKAVNQHARSLKGIRLRNVLQDISFRGNIPNHFRETGLSADCRGKQVYSPFMALPVINVAKNLSLNQYYGKNDVKPVLRELACEHYDRDLIYRRKHGFEVPQIAWLKGPLSPLVDAAMNERKLFDGRRLHPLDVEKHYSVFWSLINWQLVNEHCASKAPAPYG